MQRKGAAARASDTAASNTRLATADITREDVAHHTKAVTIKTLALLLSTPTEPTATAPTDAGLALIMAAWLSGFLVDKRRDFDRR
jgi:hypothetical protein